MHKEEPDALEDEVSTLVLDECDVEEWRTPQ